MSPLVLILWVAAIVCWVIAALRPPSWPGLIPAGLALAGAAVVVASLGG
jgi:hypothetical protein